MRIKVTGYIDTDSIEDDFDPESSMGLTENAYLDLNRALLGMNIEDVDFELQED